MNIFTRKSIFNEKHVFLVVKDKTNEYFYQQGDKY